MSFIEWITRRHGFRSLEDSFAINREAMFVGLQRAIATQQESCDEIWLVAHFFDTFVALQEFLASAGIDYQIVDQPIHEIHSSSGDGTRQGSVRLVLATLIADGLPSGPAKKISGGTRRHSAAIIVCERHPHHVHDKRLCEAAKQVDAFVTFGYMLSLDDPVVKQIISPIVLQVLEQLGLNESEMIASHYLSRLLERRLKQEGCEYTGDREAESAAQWIERNRRRPTCEN